MSREIARPPTSHPSRSDRDPHALRSAYHFAPMTSSAFFADGMGMPSDLEVMTKFSAAEAPLAAYRTTEVGVGGGRSVVD